jgi:diaminopimelate epimerase
MALISVTKCHGTGNDFILIDSRAGPDMPYAEIAKALCPRKLAIGADGVLVLAKPQSPTACASMRIFNADGSEAEMCGNGIRCIARYLYDENPERTECTIETVAGPMQTTIVTWEAKPGVRVAMGEPKFSGAAGGKLERTLALDGAVLPAYAVSMGNPHVVTFVDRDPALFDLQEVAAEIAAWTVFDGAPNVEIAQLAGDEIRMRIFERGVGETWACGTGACAAAAVAIARGDAASPVTVTTRGGAVRVSWQGTGHPAYLTGNAEIVFRSDVEIALPLGFHTPAKAVTQHGTKGS